MLWRGEAAARQARVLEPVEIPLSWTGIRIAGQLRDGQPFSVDHPDPLRREARFWVGGEAIATATPVGAREVHIAAAEGGHAPAQPATQLPAEALVAWLLGLALAEDAEA